MATHSLLVGLPDATLTHVASYLAKPSCALFAVALSAPSSSWRECNGEARRQPSTTAIIASSFNGGGMEINFADIEKSLSSKLTDVDLHALLLCVDAKKSLKRLKLAGCVKIIGHGLAPLRGSVVLEQMDLSLELHERPELSISKDAISPILESIVENDNGAALKHVVLPESWCHMLTQFIGRYNQLLESRNAKCFQCDSVCQNEERGPWVHRFGVEGYVQGYTCWKCAEHFCSRDQCPLNWCTVCSKLYCGGCLNVCSVCSMCSGCKTLTLTRCNECEQETCEDCIQTCEQCNATGCMGCLNGGECSLCMVVLS